MQLEITQNALKKIFALFEAKSDFGLCFRVGVLPGGCSGFEYQFKIENKTDLKNNDKIFEHDYNDKTINIVINQPSLKILAGSHLDYLEELHASRFLVTNPNAEATCGCGISFCIKDEKSAP